MHVAAGLSPAAQIYVAGFLARCDVLRQSGQELVDRDGLHGLLCKDATQPTRLVIDDDAAIDALPRIVAQISSGTLDVFHAAAGCRDLLESERSWQRRTATAMSMRDLVMVRPAELAGQLVIRPVQLPNSEVAAGVPLHEAVALAELADPPDDDAETGQLVKHLRSLTPAVRLFAALDAGGSVRATSGVGLFGTFAHVLFVNTHSDWRRRGVGGAMTAHALVDARETGASAAYLNASPDGTGVYERIGFETAGQVARFSRHR